MAKQSGDRGDKGAKGQGRPSGSSGTPKRPSKSGSKVSRAASIGASPSSSSRERRVIGFPAVVALIILAGIGLVVFARSTRDSTQTRPTLEDHWHSAYGIYDCATDSLQPTFTSNFDPDGIHSHNDGLIHIHPFTASVTGEAATMSVFFDAMGAEVTVDGIVAENGEFEPLEAGVECDGETAIIQVARWNNAAAAQAGEPPDEIFTDDFGDILFLGDGEAFMIARAPEGADLPAPGNIPALAEVSPLLAFDPETGQDVDLDGTVPSEPVGPAPATDVGEPETQDSGDSDEDDTSDGS